MLRISSTFCWHSLLLLFSLLSVSRTRTSWCIQMHPLKSILKWPWRSFKTGKFLFFYIRWTAHYDLFRTWNSKFRTLDLSVLTLDLSAKTWNIDFCDIVCVTWCSLFIWLKDNRLIVILLPFRFSSTVRLALSPSIDLKSVSFPPLGNLCSHPF